MPKPTFFNLPEEKRARFVDAAVAEFSAHTFAEASLSAIVREVGIAKGSVYQYFEDKLDLYRWLVFEEVGRRKLAFAGTPKPNQYLFTMLEDGCVGAMLFFRAEPRLARLALRVHEGQSDPALARIFADVRAAGRRWMVAELEKARAAKQIRRDVDLDLAAIALTHVAGPGVIDAYLTAAGTDLAGALDAKGKSLPVRELRRIARVLLGFVRDGLVPHEKRR